jgi:hypothetical protein
MNVVIKHHTAHINASSVTTFSVDFLDSIVVLYVVLTPPNAPEEAVTDGYEGALYVLAVWYLMTSFITERPRLRELQTRARGARFKVREKRRKLPCHIHKPCVCKRNIVALLH